MQQSAHTILIRLKFVVAVAFILSIALSLQLWLSERLYPLTPFFDWLTPFPTPSDKIIPAILCGLLVWVAVSQRSITIFLAAGLSIFLFLQDQSRMYPSFYEYTILLAILGIYFHQVKNSGKQEWAVQTVAICQFLIAGIYVWSGVSKLNAYFVSETFPWLIAPLKLPIYPLMPEFIGYTVACAEIVFGICLLVPSFRKIAFYHLLVMHGCLFFLIGPLRDNWNNASWTWNLASAVFLCILFSNSQNFSFKKMLQPISKSGFAVLFLIGILPALNLLNWWDSALSFNVYSGNTDTAVITMDKEAYNRTNKEIQHTAFTQDGFTYVLYLDLWNILEFNAATYPEPRIFKNVLKRVCIETGVNPSVKLIITQKAKFMKKERVKEIFTCTSVT